MKAQLVLILFALLPYISVGQLPDSIYNQNLFTSGLFMSKGKFEAKQFNNLYTQTTPLNDNLDRRDSYLTSFFQLNLGTNRNLNYGVDVLYRSTVTSDFSTNSSFKTYQFAKKTINQTKENTALNTVHDHNMGQIGGHIRVKPFKNRKFTFHQALLFPTGSIDDGFIINTDIFFEHVIAEKVLFFGDLGMWYNTSQTIFPYLKLFAGTMVGKRMAAYAMLNLPYELGPGIKFFILPNLELEFLYTYWLPFEFIVQDRRPQTFNIGLRVTNFNFIK
jgi:hypothetical protein